MTFSVTIGALTMTAPASVNLGSGAPGSNIAGGMGRRHRDRRPGHARRSVDRDRLLDRLAPPAAARGPRPSRSPMSLMTPGPSPPRGPSPRPHAHHAVPCGAPVVTGTAGVGNNTATWDPTLAVAVPAAAVGGAYTGTLTHSVS